VRFQYFDVVSLQIPGGDITDSEVLRGVMLNKDVTHAKMARRLEKPRVVLLDCPLEYKKAESQVWDHSHSSLRNRSNALS
jgi:chaperonin GroEL (HSP60 family)